MLLLDLKKVKKAAEALWIQNVVSDIIASQAANNHQKCEKTTSEEASSVKSNLITESEDFVKVVKGKFGNRVRETVKSEAEKVDEL